MKPYPQTLFPAQMQMLQRNFPYPTKNQFDPSTFNMKNEMPIRKV